MTMDEALHPRDDVDSLCVKKRRGRGLSRTKDSADTSIQRLQDYIEKRRSRLITAIIEKYWQHEDQQKKITKKQQWEEKQLYERFKRLTSGISH